MDKRLCWGTMSVAGLLLLLFLIDLVFHFAMPMASFLPFGGISVVIDVIVIIGSGIVLYLAWDAYRDVR
jgi:hypothetical protein